MAFPTTPSGSWTSDLGLPSRLFGSDGSDEGFELYEEEDAFVLSVDMPGFETVEIDVRWDDGRLYVAAEYHVDQPEVHHIQPRSEGGPNTRADLAVLCPNCHRKADGGAISRSKLKAKIRRQTK